jgi:D-3-phosphoglycerate dehydrogenase
MRPFIVVPDGLDPVLFKQLQAEKGLEIHPKSKLTQDELKELLPRVNGLIIRSATTVNADILEKAPNLKLVIRAGEGTDNIDKKLCALKGVKVSNTPGANGNSAAEQAIALMFAVLRKTAAAHGSMLKGEWEKTKFQGNELTGKTVGLVGFGRIGQIVAKRIQGFDPKVLFSDPFIEKSDLTYAHHATVDQIFKEADIISLHTPLLESTRGMVHKRLLETMKPTAILINASRGEVVNQPDLIEHLKAKKIRGAGLDVFDKEPLAKDSELLKLDNVVLTPHLGASTDEAQVRVGEMAMLQTIEFFLNNKLMHEVKA